MLGFGDVPGNSLIGWQSGAGTPSDFYAACYATSGQCYLLELYPYKRGTTAGTLLYVNPIGTKLIGYSATAVVNPNVGIVEVDYSDAGYTSPNLGQKQNIWFEGRASQPLHMQRTLPVTPEGSRRVLLAIVGIEIINSDGAMDSLLREYAIDGRQVMVKFGLKNSQAAYAGSAETQYQTFTTIYSGRAAEWKGTLDKVDITARDEAYRLAVPLQSSLYGGTGGADGSAALTGKPKPLTFGKCLNITPTLIDSSALVYQFHSRASQAVDAVYDRGAALTGPDADYANYAALTGATVTGGHYVTCLALGLIRVGSTPSGLLTADVRGDAQGGYPNDTFSIVKRILTDFAGLVDGVDIDSAGFSYMINTVTGEMGWYQDTNSILIEDAISQIAGHCSAWWGGLPNGAISVGRVESPDANAIAADLKFYDVIDAQIIEPQQNTFPPRFRQRVSYAKNWTVQGTDIAGSVTAARRQTLAQPYSVASSLNGNTQADFALAQDPPVLETLFTSQADAANEAARLINMLSGLTTSVQITQGPDGHFLRVGSTVQLTNQRINGGSPWLARVIGQDVDVQNRRVVTTLWG